MTPMEAIRKPQASAASSADASVAGRRRIPWVSASPHSRIATRRRLSSRLAPGAIDQNAESGISTSSGSQGSAGRSMARQSSSPRRQAIAAISSASTGSTPAMASGVA